jgi:2-iminobutanoate/2-iminopropanoate deaminase
MSRIGNSRRKFLTRAAASTGLAVGVLATGKSAAASEGSAKKRAVKLPGPSTAPGLPFSPAIQFGNLVFVSGQIALNPSTQKLAGGTIQDQVRQCMENVKAVVEAAGSSMDKVLKCTVFLTDMANFPAMNEVYRTYFPTDPPARSTVAVKDLAMGSPVEIECIACTD